MQNTNRDIVNNIWHYKIEDNLPWSFCAGIVEQNTGEKISTTEVKRKFNAFFKEETGILPYTKCPICGKETAPRHSQYGYFVGCSDFPTCRFLASSKKPYEL